MRLIPANAMPLAMALLYEMNKIENPTEEQRRFIGTLRAAQGIVSKNAMHKNLRRTAKELAQGDTVEEVKRKQAAAILNRNPR